MTLWSFSNQVMLQNYSRNKNLVKKLFISMGSKFKSSWDSAYRLKCSNFLQKRTWTLVFDDPGHL